MSEQGCSLAACKPKVVIVNPTTLFLNCCRKKVRLTGEVIERYASNSRIDLYVVRPDLEVAPQSIILCSDTLKTCLFEIGQGLSAGGYEEICFCGDYVSYFARWIIKQAQYNQVPVSNKSESESNLDKYLSRWFGVTNTLE